MPKNIDEQHEDDVRGTMGDYTKEEAQTEDERDVVLAKRMPIGRLSAGRQADLRQ